MVRFANSFYVPLPAQKDPFGVFFSLIKELFCLILEKTLIIRQITIQPLKGGLQCFSITFTIFTMC